MFAICDIALDATEEDLRMVGAQQKEQVQNVVRLILLNIILMILIKWNISGAHFSSGGLIYQKLILNSQP